MNIAKIFILLAAAVIFIAACGQSAKSPNVSNPPANLTNVPDAVPAKTAELVADNKKLYETNCMLCHKNDGKGGKVTVEGKTMEPDDLTSARMKGKTDEKLIQYIADGAPDDGMPAFKGKLTDDEIKAVVKHLRTLQGS